MESLSDFEQKEMLKKWWNDYGKQIAIAVIIGLIIGFVWRHWQQHKVKEALQASRLYQQVTIAEQAKDASKVQQFSSQLLRQYPKSSYASLTALFQARDAVQKGDFSAAIQHLQWVLLHSGWKPVRQIARIREARILLQQNKANEALALISVIEDKSFEPLIKQVEGDIYKALGQNNKANTDYQMAKKGLEQMGVKDPVLEMKLAQ
jgi:predicted negative regulator of RcsB-dependent stress response